MEYICKKHYRTNVHAKNKTEANMLILVLIEELKKENKEQSLNETFSEYSKDWMISVYCLWEKNVSSEGRKLNVSYIYERITGRFMKNILAMIIF